MSHNFSLFKPFRMENFWRKNEFEAELMLINLITRFRESYINPSSATIFKTKNEFWSFCSNSINSTFVANLTPGDVSQKFRNLKKVFVATKARNGLESYKYAAQMTTIFPDQKVQLDRLNTIYERIEFMRQDSNRLFEKYATLISDETALLRQQNTLNQSVLDLIK